MNVLIQFDDSNRELSAALGGALTVYGQGAAPTVPFVRTPSEPLVETTTETVEPGEIFEHKHTPETVEEVETKPVVESGESVETAETDLNGVPFNADFCGKAKDPFYKPGNKRAGQWKRRQGVDEAAYDDWYASHLDLAPADEQVEQPEQANTAAAFGGEPEPQAPATDDEAPQGAGELMRWVSEQMNAGRLTQADVDAAYSTANITPADLFGGDPEAVSSLYAVLTRAQS